MRGDAGTDPADTLRFFKQERQHLRDRAAQAARRHRMHKQFSANARESHRKNFHNTEAHIHWAYYRALSTAASGLFWAIRKASTEMHHIQRKEDTLNKLRAMA
jgi:hypothetical protein